MNKSFFEYALGCSKLDQYTHYIHTGLNIYKPRKGELQSNDFIKLSKKIKPSKKDFKFTFIDLFAGIGGNRISAERLGGKCIFSSEWDKYSQMTYFYNFSEMPFGDITSIDSSLIPRHDLLMAGFPCQAFSTAGKRLGFEDTRGTLFFEVARVIKDKRPRVVMLENVRALRTHDGGRTLEVILTVLRDDLGYYVPEPKVLNSIYFNSPQKRERIIIVAFKNKKDFLKFSYPEGKITSKRLKDILDPNAEEKYYLTQKNFNSLKNHKARHNTNGNGFGYQILSPNDFSNTVVCGGMGRERNLIIQKSRVKFSAGVNNEFVRKLKPREMARLQTFPESFTFPVSDNQAYKQIGNSVTINVIQAVVKKILEAIE